MQLKSMVLVTEVIPDIAQPCIKELVVELAMNNTGIRDTVRALHISINAVVRTLINSRHGM